MYLSIENDPREGPLLDKKGKRLFGRSYASFEALISDLGDRAEEVVARGFVVLRPGIAQSAPEPPQEEAETPLSAPKTHRKE